MNVQEIIAELEKMSPEERRMVAESLQGAIAPPQKPKRNVWDVLLEHAGTIDCLPEDMSVNHDHYLYGTPKQEP